VQPQLENVAPATAPAKPAPRFCFGVAIGAGLVFALWTWYVRPWQAPPPSFDMDCAHFWHQKAHAQRWAFMVFFTDLGGVAAMTLLTVVGALWQASHKNRLLALGWIGVAASGAILNSGCKHLIDRKRPDEQIRDVAVLEVNQSYPSGHAMGSAIGYGLLAYSLCLWQRCRWTRLLILVVTGCIVLAIGFSRMYLCAHWFSDVIGGWSIGLAWLFFCLGWLERLRVR
jgi:membrane-associated phospholipid phosphatase